MTEPLDDPAPVLDGQGTLDFEGGPPVFPCSVDGFTDVTGAVWGWECSGCGARLEPCLDTMPEAIAAGELHIQEGPRR